METIIFNCLTLAVLVYIIVSIKIPFHFSGKFKTKDSIFYLPIIIYLVIFSGGFSNIINYNFETRNQIHFYLFSLNTLVSAFLEEILFRGLIFGLLLNAYLNKINGIVKSVVLSGVLFGSIHLLNIWTMPDTSIQGVLNQIYAASCLGIMYATVYLKTRSILTLSIIHFLSNFLALLGTHEFSSTTEAINVSQSTFLTALIEEVVRLIIYGIPILISILLLNYTSEKDIRAFSNNTTK
ncbi:CPBP family intramembrane glutamic endopeptidase [Carboxylicivirga sp. M1479]|uniref:CPBP family intramembrane glutamic endopeptidase n=2 Tax=Carboxylicivirga TaxID=1628153 RepID=UPI002102A8B9|nr:CPBP family intramembrane glutamic endopeptidase [Carboxylicivirga sp. M1479]